MDLTQVEEKVEAGGGYAVVSVKLLRDATGKAKAKVNVVAEISAALNQAGYGHVPFTIPRNQERDVLVYRRAAGVGAMILTCVENAQDHEKAAGMATGLQMLISAIEGRAQ